MNKAAAQDRPLPRLNPFLFPSETKIRFILLIISLLGVTLYTYLRIGLLVFRGAWGRAEAACLVKVGPLSPSPALRAVDPLAWSQDFDAYLKAFRECDRPISLAQGGWMLGGVVLVLGLAFLLYWNYPRYLKRRQRLQPLTREDVPEVIEELEHLSRQAGLVRTPGFLWNPLDLTVSGQAFGRRGQYEIALTGGLVTKFYTDPPVFRAIVLHELAHLHNADVDNSYFTVAVWWAFVLACLLPLGLAMVITAFSEVLLLDLLILLYMIPLVLLVYLTRNSVLRNREYYADLRVSVWEGREGAIERVLSSLPAPAGARWKGNWRVHPAPAERLHAVAEPQRLLTMGFWEAFGVGLAAAVALPNLSDLFNKLVSTRPDLTNTAPAFLFAPFAMGVVGLGAYRYAFSRLMLGLPAARFARLAMGLALGIMFGLLISIGGAITQQANLESGGSPVPVGFYLLGFLLTALIAYLLLNWIAAVASAWLETTTSLSALRWISILAIGLAALLFTIWSMLLIYVANLGDDAAVLLLITGSTLPLVGPLGIFNFFQIEAAFVSSFILILLAGLWALPLAARLFLKQKGEPKEATWAFLAPAPVPDRDLPEKLRPAAAFWTGLIGGLALVILMILIRLVLRSVYSEAIRDSDQFRLTYYISQMLLAGVFQASFAALSAFFIRRLGAIHGLFTAFITGLIGVTGFLIINLFAGGTLDLWLVSQVLSSMLGWGFLFSLPVVSIAAGLGSGLRGSMKSPSLRTSPLARE